MLPGLRWVDLFNFQENSYGSRNSIVDAGRSDSGHPASGDVLTPLILAAAMRPDDRREVGRVGVTRISGHLREVWVWSHASQEASSFAMRTLPANT